MTVEAHEDVYEKAIPAFGTLFTMVSHAKIGTSAIQSRACAGVAGGTYLFALPGSPGACAFQRGGGEDALRACQRMRAEERPRAASSRTSMAASIGSAQPTGEPSSVQLVVAGSLVVKAVVIASPS